MLNLSPKDMKDIEDYLNGLEYPNFDDFGFYDCENEYDDKITKCKHEWKKEYFFSSNAYETCTKCGQKKEEL